ncbi:MAG: LON peptidase substrate-binding domain-containing protein [Pseudomonadota bacterium]
MARSPLFPSFDGLPSTTPVFPLSGVLLLPDGELPLNIFEPRYLAMVDDALAGERLIGMGQPLDPKSESERPDLYSVACAGRITAFEETDDGRYLITLTGVCRFHLGEELPLQNGYRRFSAGWSDYRTDMEPASDLSLDRERLHGALKEYFGQQGISANWEAIEKTPDERLITSLAMICPFSSTEKQAILEAATPQIRADTVLSLLEIAVHDAPGGDVSHH